MIIVNKCILIHFIFLTALLVRLQITEKSKTHGRKLTQLSKTAHDLQKESELMEAQGDIATASKLHEEAQEKEKEVMGNLLNL